VIDGTPRALQGSRSSPRVNPTRRASSRRDRRAGPALLDGAEFLAVQSCALAVASADGRSSVGGRASNASSRRTRRPCLQACCWRRCTESFDGGGLVMMRIIESLSVTIASARSSAPRWSSNDPLSAKSSSSASRTARRHVAPPRQHGAGHAPRRRAVAPRALVPRRARGPQVRVELGAGRSQLPQGLPVRRFEHRVGEPSPLAGPSRAPARFPPDRPGVVAVVGRTSLLRCDKSTRSRVVGSRRGDESAGREPGPRRRDRAAHAAR
jgi:hypothetical protein